MPAQTVIKVRRGTAAEWAAANPVLSAGEIGLETDTSKTKFGDGLLAWADLNYSVADASGTSSVDWTSVLNKPSEFPPEAHASTHELNGSDEIEIAQSQVTNLTTDLGNKQADVITTQGDLVIGDASGDASRIAIGSADQVLTSNGNTAIWADADTVDDATPTVAGKVFGETEAGANENTSFGFGATAIQGGISSTAIGNGAYNAEVGTTSLGDSASATGLQSTAIGESATAAGNFSTAVGRISSAASGGGAAFGAEASANDLRATAVGAFSSADADKATAIGNNALAVLRSTAIGQESYAEADDSTAVGQRAIASGDGSIAIGSFSTASSNQSIVIGEDAYVFTSNGGISIGDNAVVEADNCIAIGSAASADGFQDSIAIGNGASSSGFKSIALGVNSNSTNAFTIVLGDSNITSLRCNVQSISSLSDQRDKTDIQDSILGLDLVERLRPVDFTWNRRDGSMGNAPDVGFIAQEVAAVEDEFQVADRLRMTDRQDPDAMLLAQGRLVPVLTKAIQELSAKNDQLEARLAKLEGK